MVQARLIRGSSEIREVLAQSEGASSIAGRTANLENKEWNSSNDAD